jgi:protein ImuA
MEPTPAARAELCRRLRRDIASLEGRLAEADRLVLDAAASRDAASGMRPRTRRGRLNLGVPALDALLGGGVQLATLHEIRARETRDGGAAAGFVMALLARLAESGGAPSVMWISEADARRETGGLYAPGLLAMGLDPGRIIHVAVRNAGEALWAFEAALACRGLGAAICELRQVSLDLTATRRCALRAREAGVTGFLLRLASRAEPSAAELRLRLAPAPAGKVGLFEAGVGRMAWRLALEKSRGGRTGSFTVEWNAYERCFAERGSERKAERGCGRDGWAHADPQPMPAAPSYRPPHPAEAVGAGTRSGLRRAS